MAIEKYSLEIGSKLFVDMLLKILESIPLREECYDDAPQKAISILSRHLAADASIQRYAVHRAAASLSKVNDGASVIIALVYIIGEYGHLLAPGPFFHEGHLLDGNIPTPDQVLSLLGAMVSGKEVSILRC
ncbi:hypothetical protein DI09_80p60 [Mitosporidium daphniae]|uniref:Uncharacterized protein n=1 Tax=Mitosporidium daphniae TaxID=1485682 RepID=A0A098VM90_9MICR|nr:uncharacterized protein DI09_82p70 [Mitosporidium daphniae]XP_013236654.1 uncharacterized protein DI09_80p60 [Mitosporidium daphniae]KGG50188.1 hypothetical protein DI09_82p70 [Mitosporidium daphniae]KGG50212.1 hypothetical protein DI09_80p60 [Mitosporidium daphniae]|eukprot:XP_013236631.1 uncharacterized protein DI09_82p70 [Mitosporidium daphniae]